jgi:hypothetical protein
MFLYDKFCPHYKLKANSITISHRAPSNFKRNPIIVINVKKEGVVN